MKFIYDEKPDANAEEVVMVKCGTLVATLEECKTVLGGTQCVHENYVRVAGAMYTRMWRRKFGNSSIRFMIDPTFAARVFENVRRSGDWNDCREIGCAVAKGFKGVHANRIFGVFVPVLEDRKWWCAAFSVNSEEVWVIDAHRPNSLEHHAKAIEELAIRVDILFSSFEGQWLPGQITKWERKAVNMDDAHSECLLI
ncbi:uncharacterized protein LOC125497612 [Beta vulgaris subsp. vulgaris]|uniref:uncharacterized protein LOC125497612 n=1 Tax=Beta vulgaris subsp. vulgaris TaxID=3555 RepID=UPI00254899C1|nr:uncharacterized protein LOC125497612 [Beta vulgaris subsp. vulgaris]